MKIEQRVPAPVVLPPEIVITLTESEAKLLYKICGHLAPDVMSEFHPELTVQTINSITGPMYNGLSAIVDPN